jgi:hypothetical protein
MLLKVYSLIATPAVVTNPEGRITIGCFTFTVFVMKLSST